MREFDFERVNLIPNEANLLFKKEMINSYFPRREGFSLLIRMSENHFPPKIKHGSSQAFSVQKLDSESVNLFPKRSKTCYLG